MPVDETGSVFKTVDGGRHWQISAILKQWMDASVVFFVDDQFGWFMASGLMSRGGELWGTGDGGHTWGPKLTVDYTSYGFVRDMIFLDNSTGWLVTSSGHILKCAG